MSNKIKFKKLQLPKNTRSNLASQIPKTQISKFFSNNENTDKSNSHNSQENSISSSPSNENSDSNKTVLIISDEDSNNSDSNIKSTNVNNKHVNTIKEENSFRCLSIRCNNQTESTLTCSSQNFIQSECKESSQLNLQPNDQKNNIPALKTKISKFFDEHTNDDSCFETPYISPKKPKLGDGESPEMKISLNKLKLPAKRKRKKQVTIKTAFTKNEEMFTDIMAQHSIADNFNPDEIQMALALSMSENQEENNISEHLNANNKLENLDIRNKLQTFGFKTGGKKDYNLDFYIPSVSKRKTKWANRFTALTLRNSEKQLRKLHQNVEIFLMNQNITKFNLNFDTKYEYETCSNYLQNLHTNYEFIKNCNFIEKENDLENFYITELFTPSTNKIGSLMKKYENIPGRNISPKRNKEPSVESDMDEKSKDSNENLNISVLVESHEKIELDKLNENNNNINCNISSDSQKTMQNINPFSAADQPSKQEKCGTEIVVNSAINLENKPGSFVKDAVQSSPFSEKDQDEVDFKSPVKTRINHYVRSPDLFSDNEFNVSNENNVEQDISITDDIQCEITHFEKFSSDEVKIFHINSLNDNSPESASDFLEENADMSNKVIDLTQEDNFQNHSSKNKSLSYLKDSKEDVNSQDLNCSDSDCIILSDDEVNYSMALANCKNNEGETDKKEFSILKLIEDENEDLSSSNDNENACIDISNLDDFKDRKRTASPFESPQSSKNSFGKKKSFIKTSPKCKKSMSESFSKLNHSNLSTDFTSTSFRQKSVDLEFKEDCFRLSPLEIIDCTDEVVDQNHISTTNNNLNDTTMSVRIGDEYFAEDDFDLTKLRNKFGIQKTPHKDKIKKTLSECAASNYSNRSLYKTYSNNIMLDNILEKENEFDHVLHSSESQSSATNIPKNLDQLLTADIISSTSSDDSNDSFNLSKLQKKFGIEKTPRQKLYHKTVSESMVLTSANKIKSSSDIKSSTSTSLKRNLTNIEYELTSSLHNISPPKTSKKLGKYLTESNEIIIENRTYQVNTINVPEKPDYKKWDIIEIHRELDKYGVKPLKKKQGIIILEYIYNQTHPYILEDETQPNANEPTEHKIIAGDNTSKKCTKNSCNINCNLKDCFGDKLCINDGLLPELEKENYIFQTNISKKILTALVPLHIAWYNLIKSNYKLRERVLNYEPVDLQEIYLFFKSIGYRYDPKDLKRFFDARCIIFRFDLSESTNNRHIKKSKRKSNE